MPKPTELSSLVQDFTSKLQGTGRLADESRVNEVLDRMRGALTGAAPAPRKPVKAAAAKRPALTKRARRLPHVSPDDAMCRVPGCRTATPDRGSTSSAASTSPRSPSRSVSSSRHSGRRRTPPSLRPKPIPSDREIVAPPGNVCPGGRGPPSRCSPAPVVWSPVPPAAIAQSTPAAHLICGAVERVSGRAYGAAPHGPICRRPPCSPAPRPAARGDAQASVRCGPDDFPARWSRGRPDRGHRGTGPVARATFYSHYATKEEVLNDLLQESGLRVAAAIDAVPPEAAVADVFQAISAALAREWEADPADRKISPYLAAVALRGAGTSPIEDTQPTLRARLAARLEAAASRRQVINAIPPAALADMFLVNQFAARPHLVRAARDALIVDAQRDVRVLPARRPMRCRGSPRSSPQVVHESRGPSLPSRPRRGQRRMRRSCRAAVATRRRRNLRTPANPPRKPRAARPGASRFSCWNSSPARLRSRRTRASPSRWSRGCCRSMAGRTEAAT